MATSKVNRKVPALEKRVLDHLKRAATKDQERHAATAKLIGKFRTEVAELLEQAEEIKDEIETARDKVGEIEQAVRDAAMERRTDSDMVRADLEKMHRRMGALRNVVLKYIPKGESA